VAYFSRYCISLQVGLLGHQGHVTECPETGAESTLRLGTLTLRLTETFGHKRSITDKEKPATGPAFQSNDDAARSPKTWSRFLGQVTFSWLFPFPLIAP